MEGTPGRRRIPPHAGLTFVGVDKATTALGDFLRARRGQLRPADLGLPHFGRRRRVPGLRREELAQHAGLSVAYYTRLEQGESRRPSDAVLAALADALRLDKTERAHLHRLAGEDRAPAAGGTVGADPEVLHPRVAQLLAAVEDVPAVALGRWTDILAWNRLAHALLVSHLPFDAPARAAGRPNLARLLFRDPATRALYADWPRKAQDAVAHLRLVAGEYPDDPGLAALVAELSAASAEFAALWAAHPVRDCAGHARDYRHPVVGPLALADEFLRLGDAAGQRVLLLHAVPGTQSAAALGRLRQVAEYQGAAVQAR